MECVLPCSHDISPTPEKKNTPKVQLGPDADAAWPTRKIRCFILVYIYIVGLIWFNPHGSKHCLRRYLSLQIIEKYPSPTS
jgi:hypothetical protein